MNPFYNAFVFFVWFISAYFVITLLMILFEKYKTFYHSPKELPKSKLPFVTLICPAYNEGESICQSIESLKAIEYPRNKLEIIFINDGSKDNTSDLIRKHATEPYMKFIDNTQNKGKAAVLNQAIAVAKGDFIGTMDTDSQIAPDALYKTVPYFQNKKVGAVTVTVKVTNPKTFLQKIVEVEYIIGLSMSLRLLSFFNGLHVTPGPFSLYRKSMLDEIGCYDTSNIVEDHEIALRIHKAGYRIAHCPNTYVNTISPDKFIALLKQRKRWYSGTLETCMQHKDLLFNRNFGTVAFIYPLNLMLVSLGVILFLSTTFISLKNLAKKLYMYHYTGFNFFDHLLSIKLDPLNLGMINQLGIVAIILTVASAVIFIKYKGYRVRDRLPGFIGFVFMFFLYQIFWISSFYSLIKGKKVKWR